MWEDTKYPGGTQYIYYYPDYPGTELGEGTQLGSFFFL